MSHEGIVFPQLLSRLLTLPPFYLTMPLKRSFKAVGGTPCSNADLFIDMVPSITASMAATMEELRHCFLFPSALRRRLVGQITELLCRRCFELLAMELDS